MSLTGNCAYILMQTNKIAIEFQVGKKYIAHNCNIGTGSDCNLYQRYEINNLACSLLESQNMN
jgi:hypothetical protein